MGSNKTFQQKHGERVMLGESDEFRRLRHAVREGRRRSRARHPERLPPIRREPPRRTARRDPGGDAGAAHFIISGLTILSSGSGGPD